VKVVCFDFLIIIDFGPKIVKNNAVIDDTSLCTRVGGRAPEESSARPSRFSAHLGPAEQPRPGRAVYARPSCLF
jgi:hypothetical protein